MVKMGKIYFFLYYFQRSLFVIKKCQSYGGKMFCFDNTGENDHKSTLYYNLRSQVFSQLAIVLFYVIYFMYNKQITYVGLGWFYFEIQ